MKVYFWLILITCGVPAYLTKPDCKVISPVRTEYHHSDYFDYYDEANEDNDEDENVDDGYRNDSTSYLYIYPVKVQCLNTDFYNSDPIRIPGVNDAILIIANTTTPTVPPRAFQQYQFKINTLYMENLSLEIIMPGAFKHQDDSIESIFLNNNKLTTIKGGVFNHLPNLQSLHLGENIISHIDDDAFGSSNLVLSLEKNNISSINLRNVNLGNLVLAHNNIESLDAILPAARIISLDAGYNKLAHVNFALMGKIEKVRLDHNRITNISNMSLANYLADLDISFNQITSVDGLSKSLRILRASGNPNFPLHRSLFDNLYNLRELYLSDINLTAIPSGFFSHLADLEILDLSANHLSSFSYGIFDNLYNLNSLNISCNKFKILPTYPFKFLRRLTHFYAQNNEISDTSGDPFASMPELTYIDITGNRWRCNKLIEIVSELRKRWIVMEGNFTDHHNVKGIQCFDSDNNVRNVDMEDEDTSNNERIFNERFTNSAFYRFFNETFKNSSLFKYLEKLGEQRDKSSETFFRNLNATLTNSHTSLINYTKNLAERVNANSKAISELTLRNDSNVTEPLIAEVKEKHEDVDVNTVVLIFMSFILTVLVFTVCSLGYVLIMRDKRIFDDKSDIELLQLIDEPNHNCCKN